MSPIWATKETQGGTPEGEGAGGAFRQLLGLKGERQPISRWKHGFVLVVVTRFKSYQKQEIVPPGPGRTCSIKNIISSISITEVRMAAAIYYSLLCRSSSQSVFISRAIPCRIEKQQGPKGGERGIAV